MVEITVCGTALERASAERATVTVQSRWSAPEARIAMQAVAEAHERVITDAKQHVESGAAESWHADRVWISHHEEWVGEGQPRNAVYTASASVTVRFQNFEVLGAWIGRVGIHKTHEVGGIEWSLSDETQRELGKAARTRAIADAVERAGDYAAAAGLGSPVVDGIREPGTTRPGPPSPHGRMAPMAMAAADAAPAVSLEAGEIEVRAAVEVCFTTGAPQPAG